MHISASTPRSAKAGSAATSEERENGNLRVLDGLRGLAALYVVLYHVQQLTRDSSGSVESLPGRFAVTASRAFGFGSVAVLLFFLISGFCIHYKQAKQLSLGQVALDLSTYASRRFWRLYPTLVLAMLLAGAWWLIGSRLNPAFYSGRQVTNGWTGLSSGMRITQDYVPSWRTS